MANTIIFVGDSYCAWTDQSTYDFSGQPQHQYYKKDSPGHPAIVSAHYRDDLFCYGYGGKSWWYSRNKFQQALKQNPAMLDTARAVVFCHTDAWRINSTNQTLTTFHLPQNYGRWDNQQNPWDVELADASQLWLKHLCDLEFQEWAQQQYFRELAQQYTNIKTIHFHCLSHSVESSDLLPGMVYTTPLCTISGGEPGAKAIINDSKRRLTDTRANHMNAHNNWALAQVIIGAIDNYSPGQHTIDLSGFDLEHDWLDCLRIAKNAS
jgi:hypothetical protein